MFGFIYIVFILSHPIQHSKTCIIKHIVHRWSDSMILIQTQISVPMSHKNRITISLPNQVCFPHCISQIGALKQNCQTCPYSIIIYLCISSPLYNYMKVHKHWDTFLSHCIFAVYWSTPFENWGEKRSIMFYYIYLCYCSTII